MTDIVGKSVIVSGAATTGNMGQVIARRFVNDGARVMAAGVFAHEAMVETYRREYPLGRLGTAADVAEAAIFLASDTCFISGQTLQINGGLTLRRNPRNGELAAAMKAAQNGRTVVPGNAVARSRRNDSG